ncbi:hypothetical protein BCY89_15275 [Sphingobacterium siyangense]|uniref:Fimbrillin-like protein n=1 Tax=Sphingobacterium siyangense TaxID=459529 RepID=A0A420FHY7_9SPHI|nr:MULTISPECIES: hypothetical protein [Sphingobacterium]QQT30924.1 hypothetical protein I6I99_27220 [Sphingobacterium multivorum]RKF32532.1 hypothetical protein BCY89_15275 [Sphingobacterium siyangense]
MKTTNNNLASKFALAAFLALGTLAVTSCNKDKNQNGQEIPSDQSQLVVRIAGISDGENTVKKASTSTGKSSSNSIELVQSNGFDAIVAVDNNVPSNDASAFSQAALRASSGLKAATPLGSTTTYRLYLYKNNGGTYTFTKSVQFTPGSEAPIQVPNGSYKWVALSYNNTDAIPDGDASNNLVLPQNKDVLYATSGATDITINSNTAPLNITFNRLYARIAIEVNTLGMFAPINSATIAVTGQNAKAATINLATGALTVAPSGGTPALTEVNFTNLDGNAARKIAYYYTADETAQNLSVSVTNLKIQLDNSTERNFGTTTLTQNKAITPVRGKNHRFLVGITESALTFGSGSGLAQWSRSNLYYKPGDATPYRFYHTNPQTNDPNSYFSFGAHLPRVLASANAAVDACALVYPAGLWKTPTAAQLANVTSPASLGGLLGDLSLTNVAGIDALVLVQDLLAARVPNSTATATYSEFTPTSGNNSAYGAATSSVNRLRFNYNGYMNTLGVINNLITLNLGNTYGSYNAFWTSENLIGTPLINLGVKYHLGHTTGGNYKAYRTTSILSAGLLGAVSVINSPLMNIRCVRDATWATKSAAANYEPMPVYPN